MVAFANEPDVQTPQQIMHMLKRLGHYDNPAMPTGVKFEDLPNLTLHHKLTRIAIQSFQEMMKPDLEQATLNRHGKEEALIDGEIGPATEDIFNLPRCGFPDYPVPDGTLTMGKQEANWPTACRGKLKFGRMFGALPGSTKADTDKVWWGVCNNWTWALEDVDMLPVEVGDKICEIYAGLLALGGSTLAWSYLARNSCNVQLEQRYNTRTNWANIVFAVTVASHEVGHALGLPHNNDRSALMYPSIHAQSQARAGYPNQTDLNQCRSVGYTISKNGTTAPPREKLWLPRPWDKPDEPDVPTVPDGPIVPSEAVESVLLLGAGGKELRRYLVAKDRI